jgi:hypothetical protein
VLKNLTESQIKQFAGSTIYARGYNYYQDGMVEELSYKPDQDKIHATVSGSYDSYEVTVQLVNNKIKASCECPYEGYPCKHIVATLLAFSKDHERYEQVAQKRKSAWTAIEQAINNLSKKDLINMVLSCAQDYPDFQRELLVRFQPDQEATLGTLLQQINQAFPNPGSRYYDTEKITGKLNVILQSVQGAADSLKVAVHWAVADEILRELNEYGMDDEDLEAVLFEVLETLEAALVGKDSLRSEKQQIIGELMDYYIWGNSGVVDSIYDTAYSLCSDKADYQIVIAKLESKAKSSSYAKTLLADLYALIGDDQAKLKTLESDLEYGMGYWKLAEYWFDKGNQEKALAVVREGIKKGQGRKIELYQFLQDHYEKAGDYDGLSSLFREKLARGDLEHGKIADDPMYQSLEGYYQATKNYPEQVKLLEMGLTLKDMDLKFFKHCRKMLRPEDWPKFEQNILNLFEKEVKKEESNQGWGSVSRNRKVLAEIYNYKNDLDNLVRLIKNDHDLLVTYEAKLVASQPDLYLQHYIAHIKHLIDLRGREKYQLAVRYLRTVRKIYEVILQQGEKWSGYLAGLKLEYKSLRALHEELGKL